MENNRYPTRPALNVKDGTDEIYGTDKKYRFMNDTQTLGWKQSCKCKDSKPTQSTVLDPFAGSGTTLWVAKKLGRKAIGYELSEKYCELIVDRNRQQVIL